MDNINYEYDIDNINISCIYANIFNNDVIINNNIYINNIDIINNLYNKYINDSQYVFYKDSSIILILQKTSNNNLICFCEIIPKLYYSDSLKVILMFNMNDPYKLVFDLPKYKIDMLVKSYCYLTIKEAYSVFQDYYENGQKSTELHCIDGKLNGFYQEYHENGTLHYSTVFLQNVIQK